MTIAEKYIKEGDIVIDATAGNGFDTLALSNLVGEKGKVYAFDIQDEAIRKAKKYIKEQGIFDNVVFINDSHENLTSYTEEKEGIAAVVFNLGYLPSGNKEVVTRPSSSVAAIRESFEVLKTGGLISIVLYPGTDTGMAERDEVLSFVKGLDAEKYHVCLLTMPNQKNSPPEIIWIEVK